MFSPLFGQKMGGGVASNFQYVTADEVTHKQQQKYNVLTPYSEVEFF
jgi:hypothetical protein